MTIHESLIIKKITHHTERESLIAEKQYIEKALDLFKKERLTRIPKKIKSLFLSEGKSGIPNRFMNLRSKYFKICGNKQRLRSLSTYDWAFFARLKPGITVKKTRLSGRTIFVPAALPKKRQIGIGLRWLLDGIRLKAKKFQSSKKQKLSIGQLLSLASIQGLRKKGFLKRKRDDLHKLAEKSRSFLHLSW